MAYTVSTVTEKNSKEKAMKEITVKASDIAAAMGRKSLTHYMESVIEAGHLPGTLSGANIGGEAKR